MLLTGMARRLSTGTHLVGSHYPASCLLGSSSPRHGVLKRSLRDANHSLNVGLADKQGSEEPQTSSLRLDNWSLKSDDAAPLSFQLRSQLHERFVWPVLTKRLVLLFLVSLLMAAHSVVRKITLTHTAAGNRFPLERKPIAAFSGFEKDFRRKERWDFVLDIVLV